MYFHDFFIISSLEKGGALHLNKLESHTPKDALCQVWLKLAQWFWRRRFFEFRQCILTISLFIYHPLQKGGALHLNKLESHTPKDALCQVWLKLALWFWRRFFEFRRLYFHYFICLLYTSPSPRDLSTSRMPSSA